MNQTVKMPALRVGAKTHVGKVRSENQDRMGRFPSPLGELYIVVDGMGGHKGGATAAAMTIDGFDAYLKSFPPGIPPDQALQDAAQRTNSDIYQKANNGDPETANMGATLVLGLVRNWQIIIAHAGDSRAYRFRAGRLERLTRDHSVVQRMIDHNMITEEQARDHPDASVITRAFGQKTEIELEISPPLELVEGDGILLCSDGLCGYVDDPAIEQVIGRYRDAQQITDALIDLALAAGGEDNVTVQFLQCGERKRRAMSGPAGTGREATGRIADEIPLALSIGLVSAIAVLLSLIVLFFTGVIGWGSLIHSPNNANNTNAPANENHPVNNGNKAPENANTSNANTSSAGVQSETQASLPTNANANTSLNGGNNQGQVPSSITATGATATGSGTGASLDSIKPPPPKPFMGILLPASPPDVTGSTVEAGKQVDEIYSVGGRKILYLFYDPDQWLDKGIYCLKPEYEPDAKILAQKFKGRLKVKPLPNDFVKEFAKDFEGYEIIIHP
ncbi:MAG: family protein phosphatase [Blastocatellia bacterium]